MSEGFRQHSYQPPEGATEVILVRHGESRAATKENPFPLVDGHGDPELHPNGEQQAIAVGERLKDEQIDAIYVTSLQRTVQTARACSLLRTNRQPHRGPAPAPSRRPPRRRRSNRPWQQQQRL